MTGEMCVRIAPIDGDQTEEIVPHCLARENYSNSEKIADSKKISFDHKFY